jgi:hypothetical protein
MLITLERFAYTPVGAFGRLRVGDWQCYTVERPWAGNRTFVSCIPEGVYRLRMRPSGVVARTTDGKYTEGWEVTGVPGRTYIMLHIGNTMDDVEGCVAPGLDIGTVYGKWAVTDSTAAFRELMSRIPAGEHDIDVRCWRLEWP